MLDFIFGLIGGIINAVLGPSKPANPAQAVIEETTESDEPLPQASGPALGVSASISTEPEQPQPSATPTASEPAPAPATEPVVAGPSSGLTTVRSPDPTGRSFGGASSSVSYYNQQPAPVTSPVSQNIWGFYPSTGLPLLSRTDPNPAAASPTTSAQSYVGTPQTIITSLK